MIGPEIDFTHNTGPARVVIFTDWEARLVDHCLSLYIDAAKVLNDSTLPLALRAHRKVTREGRATLTPDEARSMRRQRGEETRFMSPEYGERLDLVEKKWADAAMQLAVALEQVDPTVLDRVRFGRHDGGGTITAAEWLVRRRQKAAERATA